MSRRRKPEPQAVAPAVGVQVQRLRTERGWSQDELAQRLGLPKWTRVQVARLERGSREGLGLDEALALARTLGVSVVALLPKDVPLRLGGADGPTVPATTARDLLEGTYEEERGGGEVIPTPDGLLYLPVEVSARSEAVVRAAQALGLTAEQVEEHALAEFGRGLVSERDRRLAEQVPADASPRSRQAARGHVMRGLLAELRQSIEGEQ